MFGLGSSGMLALLPLGFVVVVIMLLLSARKQGTGGWSPGPSLVLKKFTINKTAIGQAALIEITGRPGGLISWLLTLLGLDSTWNLKVTSTDVSLRAASLFGQQDYVTTVSSLSSVSCGYRKPMSFFFISAVCLLLGVGGWISGGGFTSFLGGLIFAAVFFVFYFLNKTIVICVFPRAGVDVFGISFKRSVIENIPVDIQQAQLVVGIINSLVIRVQNINKVTSEEVMEDATKMVIESKSSAPKVCTHCGKPLEEGSRFCTSCGHGI